MYVSTSGTYILKSSGQFVKREYAPLLSVRTVGEFASKTLGLDLNPMEAKSNYGMRDEQEKTFMMQKGVLGEDRLRVCTDASNTTTAGSS